MRSDVDAWICVYVCLCALCMLELSQVCLGKYPSMRRTLFASYMLYENHQITVITGDAYLPFSDRHYPIEDAASTTDLFYSFSYAQRLSVTSFLFQMVFPKCEMWMQTENYLETRTEKNEAPQKWRERKKQRAKKPNINKKNKMLMCV